MDLSILYRGPLSSCNYGCEYCPFAKKEESYSQLEGDRAALQRFVQWAGGQQRFRLGVLFTPWGEALIRHWYQEAIAALSHMQHVRRVAIQTNLSCNLAWIDRCDISRLGLWCTYHPSEIRRTEFLEQCRDLSRRKVRYSVGIVGLKENMKEARALRAELPGDVYLWVNAFKRTNDYYSQDEAAAFTAVDPLFQINNTHHDSFGAKCRAGATAISVDGDGVIRRCHFIKDAIGNIHEANWDNCLQERLCTNQTCGCHIGYVHLDRLKLYETFGEGMLERIPARSIQDSASGL